MMQAAMQMMGGMGGGNPMGGMDPQQIGQMLQNPMVQQMMQNITQNPAMLQQMIQSNPMLQQMTQNNPMMAQMMSNPESLQAAMQMMQNPQMMQALGGMRSLTSGNAEGTQQPTGMGGGANPMAAMMQGPAMMQAAMQMMGGMGGTAPGAGGNPEGTQQPTMPPAATNTG